MNKSDLQTLMNAHHRITATAHAKTFPEACTNCPHGKEFDLIKGQCVASTKLRTILLGKSSRMNSPDS